MFSALPLEIIWKVLENLDGKELVKFKQVSKFFKQCIDHSISLYYKITLEICGYEDGPWIENDPFPTKGSRLNALRDHINRWHQLEWKESRLTVPGGGAYEFVGGVYATVTGPDQDSMSCVLLPSRIRGTLSRSWTHEKIGFAVKDFAIDPDQDLLILLELRHTEPVANGPAFVTHLHIRTLSTDSHHPLARVPVLSLDKAIVRSPLQSFSRFQIFGSTLGLLWDEGDMSSFQLWSWDTGELIHVSEEEGRSSFCLLDPNTYLFSRSPRYLRLCQVVDQNSVQELTILELPVVSEGVASSFVIHSDAPPSSKNRRPFGFSPHRRLIQLQWRVRASPEHHQPLDNDTTHLHEYNDIFFYSDIFMGLNHKHSESLIPWAAWGPRNSRVIKSAIHPNFFWRFIHGWRFVHFLQPSTVQLIDFTPARSCWLDPPKPPLFFNTDHIDPSRTASDKMEYPLVQGGFIESSLPVQEVRRRIAFKVLGDFDNGVMLDEEHIIFINTRQDVTEHELIILTM